MSDQSLRAALETLVEQKRAKVEGTHLVPVTILERLLAAHPGEPAPVVTDEAVMELARALAGTYPTNGQIYDARAALEAAVPLLGPRSLLDREAVSRAFRREAGPWLTANRDAVTDAATEAVMELARPMPTREQIETAIDPEPEHRDHDDPWILWTRRATSRRAKADAVLALLNGAES